MSSSALDSPIEERRPLREEVYARLKQAIIEGQLPPGAHLIETKLAERFGVSRVPVREAIRSLERESLVSPSAKGMVVSSFTRTSINEVYTVRAALEALGCRLAAQHITPEEKARLPEILECSRRAIADDDIAALTACDIEFHEVLIAASRNATLSKVLAQLRDSVRRYRSASIALRGRPQEVLRDHTAIAKAVIAGDAERAETLVHDHILEAADRLLETLKDQIE
ncbi:MAG: GntR family transcriptional regulator [Chloroflexi bacterium]|nr:GntR family transcriptional regulator [Chloroflexota bacterium]